MLEQLQVIIIFNDAKRTHSHEHVIATKYTQYNTENSHK